jgi:ribosomal protein L16 Arg81 hydroxylase
MNVEQALSSIKDQSIDALKEEFLDLLSQAKKDKHDFTQFMAQQTSKALIFYAEGKISIEDATLVLKKGKKMAQIEANNAEIALLSRIHKIVYRLLDIAIDALLKAIIPL